MTDFLFVISDRPRVVPAGTISEATPVGHVYARGVVFNDDRYLVAMHGTFYGGGATARELVESYVEKGDRCFAGIDGDFGLVVFDKAQGRVVAARDKFGVRSLYYSQRLGVFAVAGSTLALCAIEPELRRPSLRKHLYYVGSHYRHIDAFAEETFFEEIRLVRQGWLVAWQAGEITRERYWQLDLLDLGGLSADEIAETYVGRIRASVERRLAGSRAPVFMVSSGMDSSGIAALASQVLGDRVPIMTTVFDERTEYNEADEIVPVAKAIASDWHRLTVQGDGVLGDVDTILAGASGPFYTITQLMHHYLSRGARERGFDVLFGGLGGDEANCGEIEEYLFYFADLQARGDEAQIARDMTGWIAYHSHPLYPKDRGVLDAFFRKQIDFTRPGMYAVDRERFRKYFTVFGRDYHDAHFVEPTFEYPYTSYLLNRLHQDLYFEIIPCVLRAEEFNLATAGLQGRYPYFAGDVMQYGFSIPLSMKYQDGGTKAILRRGMRGILPDETLNNFIKKGWNAPFDEWLRTHLRTPIAQILDEPTARQASVYDLTVVRGLFEEHLERRANHMLFFWQFLNYERWFSRHFPSLS